MTTTTTIIKTKAYTAIIAVCTVVLFSTLTAFAQTEHRKDAEKPMQHDMSKMDMAGMMNEPHHALAEAYMQSIGLFAKALHSQSEGAGPLNVKFAREAVAEMKRSLDHMEEHLGEHMKMMNDEMRSHMDAMMKEMEMHRSMLKDAISALEKDVRADQLSSKQVASDSANLIKHLDEMSKMHQD